MMSMARKISALILRIKVETEKENPWELCAKIFCDSAFSILTSDLKLIKDLKSQKFGNYKVKNMRIINYVGSDLVLQNGN